MSFGLWKLALRGLRARKAAILLSMLAVALSVGLLVTTEKIRAGARAGFESTITGTDLVVGARTGPLSLILYSVFRLGDPLQSVSWETFELVANHRDVAWVVPLSLGDSHRGYRVLGTDDRYLQHYQYGDGQELTLSEGAWISEPAHAVIGAEVARSLNYEVGQPIILSHGIVSASFADHADDPFTVAGILAPTGTPVDRTVHVSLAGIEAIHNGFDDAAAAEPQAVTAFLVGMKNRPLVLRFQRSLNTYQAEPLTAVIPGVALSRLWSIVGPIETILTVITLLVFAVGMIGLATTLLASLNGRKREMAILRSVGARPFDLLALLTIEAVLTASVGVLVGLVLAYGNLWLVGPFLSGRFGLVLQDLGPGTFDVLVFGGVLTTSLIAGLIPGVEAYRQGLAADLSASS